MREAVTLDMKKILCTFACSVQADEPYNVATVRVPNRQIRSLRKRLRGSENWQIAVELSIMFPGFPFQQSRPGAI